MNNGHVDFWGALGRYLNALSVPVIYSEKICQRRRLPKLKLDLGFVFAFGIQLVSIASTECAINDYHLHAQLQSCVRRTSS